MRLILRKKTNFIMCISFIRWKTIISPNKSCMVKFNFFQHGCYFRPGHFTQTRCLQKWAPDPSGAMERKVVRSDVTMPPSSMPKGPGMCKLTSYLVGVSGRTELSSLGVKISSTVYWLVLMTLTQSSRLPYVWWNKPNLENSHSRTFNRPSPGVSRMSAIHDSSIPSVNAHPRN